ncbi:RNA-directed DNA polymerase, eukaryota, reverse transcriptase zinc-binding domain protein [Tanacetum coccineum]|uniref:RNA-directed DNA polymerase, eukaryota, reverse transcriptase zinc-binding domain protein n=1 Tax=Tanacetum coccineum TaxID=301880 RepID=A0ABQ5I908_9ASTR
MGTTQIQSRTIGLRLRERIVLQTKEDDLVLRLLCLKTCAIFMHFMDWENALQANVVRFELSFSSVHLPLHQDPTEGFSIQKVVYLGGLWVMFELPSANSKSKFLAHVGCPYAPWSSNTFHKIGSMWGEVLELGDCKDECFARKRLCIKTNRDDNILEKFKIIVKGKSFVVRAKELCWGKRLEKLSINNVEEESDIEAVSETFFGDQADDLNEVVDSARQSIPKENSLHTLIKARTDVDELVAQKDHFQPDVKTVGSSSTYCGEVQTSFITNFYWESNHGFLDGRPRKIGSELCTKNKVLFYLFRRPRLEKSRHGDQEPLGGVGAPISREKFVGLFWDYCGVVLSSTPAFPVGVISSFNRPHPKTLNPNHWKSQLLGVGIPNLSFRKAATLIGCSVLHTPFKYLGIMVGENMSSIRAWDETVNKLKMSLSSWKLKTLSIEVLLPSQSWYSDGEEKLLGVSWSKVLRVKSNGGLESPVIHALHGSNTSTLSASYSSLWSSIIKECNALKSQGDSCLRLSYPRLFALENNKVCSVAAKMSAPFVSSLRRDVRGGEESASVSISDLLDTVVLSNMGIMVSKQIPIKVNVLAWKISMDRLPTRVNLHRGGVQVSPISCPICCEALKNLDHFGCFVATVAKDIARTPSCFNQFKTSAEGGFYTSLGVSVI